MKTFKLTITMRVNDSWIADGFNPRERTEQIENMLHSLLPYANDQQFKNKVKVTAGPTDEEIKYIQGF